MDCLWTAYHRSFQRWWAKPERRLPWPRAPPRRDRPGFDTPRGRKPDGCSEHAPGAPHRVRPRRGRPAPKGGGRHRQASEAQYHRWLKRSAPVQHTLALIPARPIARNRQTRVGWEGAQRLSNQPHMRARNRQWTSRDGLKPAHASPHAVKGGGLRRAKALLCHGRPLSAHVTPPGRRTGRPRLPPLARIGC